MNAAGQGAPAHQQQQHFGHAPDPPQQQYYAQQQPGQPSQPQYQHDQQYQQYQQYQRQQQRRPYQPPQQPQYYYPPQQQQYAPPPTAAPQIQPPVAAPSHQQHFLAELDASSSTAPAAKPGPVSTSTSSPPAAAAAQVQHGTPGTGTAYEMLAEATAPKPDNASKPQTVASASSPAVATTSPTAVVANADPAEQAGQEPPPPPVQANPWGFFLPADDDDDDPPERSGSASPAKQSLTDDQTLAVKPLRIVKTGPAEENPGSGPQGGAAEDVAPQPLRPAAPEAGAVAGVGGGPRPVGGSPDMAQLAPAPLNITRPQSPAVQHRPPGPASFVSSAASSASQLPYPADDSGIPTPGSYPAPQSGNQLTLPIHPAATGSPLHPASPTPLAPSPLTPLPTGAVAPQPQQQHYQVAPQQLRTQASPVSPIIVQAGLPPTLPVASYFPQQPSYARPETTRPAQASPSAHHSPVPSVSSTATTQPGPPTGQHSPAQPYTSPPPSYSQAVIQGQPATVSPTSLPQFPQPPAPAQPLSPNPTGVPLPMSPPPSQYPYSPASVGADTFGIHHRHHHHQAHPAPQQQQQYPYNQQASPPIPQASYMNGPQSYHPTAPPLPPRPSPPTPSQYGQYPSPSPYGIPLPTRPNYQSPPPRPDSRFFSSATARKLLSKTTELVDQTITPYLQDHRYRPPPQPNAYQYQYQYQCPSQNRPPSVPQGQYHQQGYAPSQPTYAAPHAARENPDVSRPS